MQQNNMKSIRNTVISSLVFWNDFFGGGIKRANYFGCGSAALCS